MATCPSCQHAVPEGAPACLACGGALAAGGAEAPLVGATVAGRFFVHRLLGRGGMAAVYQATDLSSDRTVALKVVDAAASGAPDAARRFRREAEAVGRLRHPGIAALLDTGETGDGGRFLAVELVQGPTLARLVAEGPIPEPRALRWTSDVLSALAAAHAAGVVHRDLKPANVMLARGADGAERAVVLDFGIAALTDLESGGDQRLTEHGLVLGTPAYMSPEQIRGDPVDARSDLYAVGAVLHELLTGAPPFAAGTRMALAACHLTEAPPSVRGRRPEVSARTDALVSAALAKEAAARPASAEAMRAEVLACLAALSQAGAAAPGLAPTEVLPALAATARPARRRLALAGAIAVSGAVAALLLRPPAPTTSPLPAKASAQAPAQDASPVSLPPPAAPGPAPVAPARAAPPAPLPRPAAPLASARLPPPAPASARPTAVRLVRGELNSIPTPPAASGEGVLVVVADPWADVAIDGEPVGETPREVRLRAGSYQVRAVHPELGERSGQVAVAPGERRLWSAAFGP